MDLLGNMRNGTFVEIGGNDGLSTTNTYHLERCLGWQGLLIEGHPENFNKMVRARPGALNLGTAVCSHPNPHPNPQPNPSPSPSPNLTLTLILTLT